MSVADAATLHVAARRGGERFAVAGFEFYRIDAAAESQG